MAAKRGRGVSTTRGGGVAAKRGRPRKHPPKLVKDKVLDDDVLEPKHIRSLPKCFADGANDNEAMDIDTAAGPVEAAEVGSADNAETAPDPKKKRASAFPERGNRSTLAWPSSLTRQHQRLKMPRIG